MHTKPTLSVEEGAPYPKERKAFREEGVPGAFFLRAEKEMLSAFGEVRVGYFGAERNAALVLRHKILQSVILGKISVWSKNSGGGNLQKAK